ncbi:MAG: PLP-dependent aminotransferase family protein [Nevskia sp.]|nr:PLP-dependent aminotransferase family protein [Nevskia sp.]
MLYRELVEELSHLIRSGALRAGEKLPSVRALRRQRGVSQSTVLRTYDELQRRGLVEARARSGYFATGGAARVLESPAQVRPPRGAGAVDVAELVFSILRSNQGAATVPLGSAFISPYLFPLARLGKVLGAAARDLDPWTTVADLPPGSWNLRRQIARRYAAAGARVTPDEIVVTAGAMEALGLCLRAVTAPGDIVAVESPAFYGALQAIEERGLRAVEVMTHPQHGIDLDSLMRTLDRHPVKACWFMTSFQNPLGSLMPQAARQELVRLLAERKIPLIEDDAYAELYFGKAPPRPAKAFDQDGLVLHCGTFSKCLAPGYRIGWAAPGRFAERVARLKLMRSICTNVPTQEALGDFLGKPRAYDDHLRVLRLKLQAQQHELLRAIAKYFPADTRVTRPQGGYFAWVELPAQVDTLRLHQAVASRGISIAPGPIFSAQRRFANCLRLNYGHPWSEKLEDAMAAIGRQLRRPS